MSGENQKYRFLFLGPPGSGKGTYAKRLAKRYDVPHISTGDMLREFSSGDSQLAKEISNYLENGELVPDELMIKMISERLSRPDAEGGFSMDGFPRTITQAEMLDDLFEKTDQKFDYIFYLWASEEDIIERTALRVQCTKCGKVYNMKNNPPKVDAICDACGGKVEHRKDDKPEMIRKRFEVYREKTQPIIDHYTNHPYFEKIYTGGPVGVAEVTILDYIKSTGGRI